MNDGVKPENVRFQPEITVTEHNLRSSLELKSPKFTVSYSE